MRQVLFNALDAHVAARAACESYAVGHGFRNLDHMLDSLVYESDFAVIGDNRFPSGRPRNLAKRFNFGAEVLELSRYRNALGEDIYQFEPFLADLRADLESPSSVVQKTVRR